MHFHQWLTITRCCTCLVSDSRPFHPFANLTPRFYVWPIQWIENNYCLLPVSFPWLARPLKSDTLCHKVFLCPIQINRNFSIACMVLFASYHPEISNLFLWSVAHVRCLRFPIVSYICKFNPLFGQFKWIKQNHCFIIVVSKSIRHLLMRCFTSQVSHFQSFQTLANLTPLSILGQFDDYLLLVGSNNTCTYVSNNTFFSFKQHLLNQTALFCFISLLSRAKSKQCAGVE